MFSGPPPSETIDVQQKLARVQSLLEAARRVHATIKLDEVLAGVLEIAAKELEADGAFFVAAGVHLDSRMSMYGQVPDDWTRWSERNSLPGYASARMAWERGDTGAHLVIYRQRPLSLEEEDFLEGLALQSALAIGNAQHHARMLEWERVQLDLDAARAIQRSLLPQSVPSIDGYSIETRSTTCYEVGGDYLDVVPAADGRLMMIVADVAGKGLASALMSATFRSSFRAMAGTGLSLDAMAVRLNQLHWEEGVEAQRRYVTAILACLDPHAHSIEIVNAGHNPAFLVAPGNQETAKVHASGPPLGMLSGRTYEIERHDLLPGSRMLFYTDGLTEVFRGDEEFGEERLLDLLKHQQHGDLLDHVWRTLARFSGNSRQTDDMTAVCLRRTTAGGLE